MTLRLLKSCHQSTSLACRLDRRAVSRRASSSVVSARIRIEVPPGSMLRQSAAAAAAAEVSTPLAIMDLVQTRASSALLGALVGDAAAQTSHWNYDRIAFHKSLKEANRFETPEFFMKNAFYRCEPGSQSCYGDQCLEVARHISASIKNSNGRGASSGLSCDQDIELLVNRFELAFGEESPYGPMDKKPKRDEMPISGPWRHASIRGFLENLSDEHRSFPDCGSDDEQFDCLARMVPVVCANAGKTNMLDLVEVAIRTTQNSDRAVAYGRIAARILEACILDKAHTIYEAVTIAIDAEEKMLDMEDYNDVHSHRVKACKLIRLVLDILDGSNPPTDLEGALEALKSQPAMMAYAKGPVALVA